MKFTTYVPIKDNNGTPFDPKFLTRVIDQLWQPFHAMSEEGEVKGIWTDDDGLLYRDVSRKISIACPRERLQEAIRAAKRVGRRLGQKKMYFEVQGYDGVQTLPILPVSN